MSKKIFVSEEGLERLKTRLRQANEELAAIRAEKSTAYTQTGDTWHDNPYFNRLEQDERRKAEEVGELNTLVASAETFSPEKRNTSRVQLGSIVHLRRYYLVSGEEDEMVWEVVGYGETNVPKKQVAYDSPMAQALMGHHEGEVAQSNSPKGQVEYHVLGLFADWDDVPQQFKRG